MIDPKPLVGEREFAVAPIARSRELGHSRRDVRHRFDRVTSELGLDRERARGWAVGRRLRGRRTAHSASATSRWRGGCSRDRSRPLRRRLHACEARAGARPEGYRRLGERFGLTLDPARYDDARAAAVVDLKRHPELDHDEEVWVAFTERIIRGMGGDADSAYACAVEMTKAWEHAEIRVVRRRAACARGTCVLAR